MTAARPIAILRQLDDAAATDRELLDLFIRQRDQAAFADLVVRHGPLVLGVCLRIVRQRQDAEDAFQAAFLTLARKAGSIKNPDLLGNWLYGVAVRVALRAKRAASRRLKREVAVSVVPERSESPAVANPELAGVIDEELAGMPAWYRDAVVLCDLRGLPRPEAARLLGVPEGTLSSRLAAGRKKLANRMTKRGFALAAGVIPAAVGQAAVAVQPALLTSTCKLVSDYTAGVAIPRPLTKLSDGGMTMRSTLLLGLLTSTAGLAGVVYAAQPNQPEIAAEPPKPAVAKSEVKEQAKPVATPEEKGNPSTTTPALANIVDLGVNRVQAVRWDSRGTQMAVQGMARAQPANGQMDLDERITVLGPGFLKGEPINLPEHSNLAGFTPNGKYLLTTRREYEFISGFHQLDFWQRREQGNENSFKLVRSLRLDPARTSGYAFAPDEKTFRTVAYDLDPTSREIKKVSVTEVDATTGKWLKTLISAEASTFALSADGKRFATFGSAGIVEVYDVDHGLRLSSYTLPPESRWQKGSRPSWLQPSLAFSPDNRRLLVYSGLNHPRLLDRGETEYSLFTTGPIGQAIVLFSDSGKPLPALEAAGTLAIIHPSFNAFTCDGRLLALSGQQYGAVSPETAKAVQNEAVRRKQSSADVVVRSSVRSFLTVWDTETGKVVKNWDTNGKNSNIQLAFNPARPVLTVMEPKSTGGTRLGFWDFTAKTDGK